MFYVFIRLGLNCGVFIVKYDKRDILSTQALKSMTKSFTREKLLWVLIPDRPNDKLLF